MLSRGFVCKQHFSYPQRCLITCHRGDFYDYLKKVFINSGLNGVKNICSLGKGSVCKNRGLFKLCNPLKFKSDHELMGLSYSIVLG